jgi:hypothetical protein
MNIRRIKDFMIAVDFDGTLCENAYPAIGRENHDMIDLVNELYDEGYIIQIWTCREGEKLEAVREFMEFNEIQFDTINENPLYRIQFWGSDVRKTSADVFIDDKSVGGLPNTRVAYEYIRETYDKKLFYSNENIPIHITPADLIGVPYRPV